jgi:hypothetical protein
MDLARSLRENKFRIKLCEVVPHQVRLYLYSAICCNLQLRWFSLFYHLKSMRRDKRSTESTLVVVTTALEIQMLCPHVSFPPFIS